MNFWQDTSRFSANCFGDFTLLSETMNFCFVIFFLVHVSHPATYEYFANLRFSYNMLSVSWRKLITNQRVNYDSLCQVISVSALYSHTFTSIKLMSMLNVVDYPFSENAAELWIEAPEMKVNLILINLNFCPIFRFHLHMF